MWYKVLGSLHSREKIESFQNLKARPKRSHWPFTNRNISRVFRSNALRSYGSLTKRIIFSEN